MRAIGFALVLIGLVTIYLAVKGKIGDAISALITGNVPSGTSEQAFQQQQTDNFYNNDPLSRGNLPTGTPNKA